MLLFHPSIWCAAPNKWHHQCCVAFFQQFSLSHLLAITYSGPIQCNLFMRKRERERHVCARAIMDFLFLRHSLYHFVVARFTFRWVWSEMKFDHFVLRVLQMPNGRGSVFAEGSWPWFLTNSYEWCAFFECRKNWKLSKKTLYGFFTFSLNLCFDYMTRELWFPS